MAAPRCSTSTAPGWAHGLLLARMAGRRGGGTPLFTASAAPGGAPGPTRVGGLPECWVELFLPPSPPAPAGELRGHAGQVQFGLTSSPSISSSRFHRTRRSTTSSCWPSAWWACWRRPAPPQQQRRQQRRTCRRRSRAGGSGGGACSSGDRGAAWRRRRQQQQQQHRPAAGVAAQQAVASSSATHLTTDVLGRAFVRVAVDFDMFCFLHD